MIQIIQDLEKTWTKDRYYTISEMASKLGRHRKTVENWIRLGLGKRRIILESELMGGVRVIKGEWIIDFLCRLNRR